MLHCTNCFSLVENNRFENVLGYSDAIDFDGEMGSGSVIRGNLINGSEDDGIDLGFSSPLIEQNWIVNCVDKAISLEGSSSPSVINSIIAQCDIGIAVKDKCHASIIHNTIVSCTTGIDIYEKNLNQGGGIADIINCVIWDTSLSLQIDGLSSASLIHSDLMQLPSDLIDTNFSLNPGFKDLLNLDVRLSETSPLIDSGISTGILVDYSGVKRPHGSAPDIGAYEIIKNTFLKDWILH